MHRGRRAGGPEVANGNVDHPSNVGDIVDVPIPIDRRLWNCELVSINTVDYGHGINPTSTAPIDPENHGKQTSHLSHEAGQLCELLGRKEEQ